MASSVEQKNIVRYVVIDEQVGFDELSVEEAADVLGKILIPACKEQGINLYSKGYYFIDLSKKCHSLRLCVAEIELLQRTFAAIDLVFDRSGSFSTRTSYGFKHDMEKCLQAATGDKHEYVPNLELIIVMLLKGIPAKFESFRKKNCLFKAKLKVGQEKEEGLKALQKKLEEIRKLRLEKERAFYK